MIWHELLVQDVPRASLRWVSERLFALGAAGLQEEAPPGKAPPPRQPWDDGPEAPPADPVWVRAWYEADVPPDAAGALRDILPDAPVSWSLVPDTDWEAQSHAAFPPVVVSARLVVVAPWDAADGTVVIDPGEGFGTGSHETTRAALAALDGLADDDDVRTVLDVGCGSGVLALAAATLGLEARGIDIDEAAVRNAEHNARLNDLDVPFDTTPVDAIAEPADVVLANLFAEVLVALASDLVRLTGRHLVLAGILADREHTVRAVFDATFGAPTRVQDGEWICLHYRRDLA